MEVEALSNRHLAAAVIIAASLVAALGGCAHRVAVPRQPADIPGYHKAPPDLVDEDVSALDGQRILIDPGHGGFFRGAVGDEGLTEAEVNLGVALYLQGLLQWAGAEVHLTRTVDMDFLSPADSSLTSDLAARVAICDSLLPDVFLSIHHNSTASRDPDVNETQTYHPLGRSGADLDLALCVHRQLVRALEISPAKILPGGFYVLRHAPVPAVLGEPAMLSNPVIEGRLSMARSLELEARAYFLGLRDYFAGGTPRWETAVPDTVSTWPSPRLSWIFDGGRSGAPGLDPTTLEVLVDGRPVAARMSPDGRTVHLGVSEVRNARHLSISARNLVGRAAADRQHVIVPNRGAWHATAIGDEDGRTLYTFTIENVDFDRSGPFRLARDGQPEGGIELPEGRRRRGWLLMDPAPDDLGAMTLMEHDGARWVNHLHSEPSVTDLEAGWSWLLLRARKELWPQNDVPGRGWRLRTPEQGALATTDGWPHTVLHPDWPVIPVRRGEPLWLEADGALPLLLDAAGNTPEGDQTTPHPQSLSWRPLLPALIGRRIAIDPRGGGTDEQGRGPLGTRGSDLNLGLARRLAALLRGAGCEVVLVRDDDLHTPATAKVQRATDFDAELYLALGRGTPRVKHHPGSRVGEPWAHELAAVLTSLLPDSVGVQTAYDYALRHTACPAVVVMLETATDRVAEERLLTPAWQDATARALFRGIVGQLSPDAPWLSPVAVLTDLGERAIPCQRLDYLRLDGNFSWLPPAGHGSTQPVASWEPGDPGLPAAGQHHVLELHAGPHWQLWTLTRQPSGEWHGRVFMENR